MGNLNLGKIAGIPFRIHWSFGLILLYASYIGITNGGGLLGTIILILFILTIFFCVTLHELGHAMAARKYGIPTDSITLYPIGGIARLRHIPEKPWQEFVIAIAGPLVNVAIVTFLLPFLYFFYPDLFQISFSANMNYGFGSILKIVIQANIILILFNMVPAFPMDGGRILRALLAMKLDYLNATKWASYVGRFLALLFILDGLGLLGLYNKEGQDFFLAFIGFYIFSGAFQEYRTAVLMAELEKKNVSDYFKKSYQLGVSAKLRVLALYQDTKDQITHLLQIEGDFSQEEEVKFEEWKLDPSIAKIAYKKVQVGVIDIGLSLKDAFLKMQLNKQPLLLVMQNEEQIGVLPYDVIAQLLIEQRETVNN